MANKFMATMFNEEIDQEKEFNDFIMAYGANESIIDPYTEVYSVEELQEYEYQACERQYQLALQC